MLNETVENTRPSDDVEPAMENKPSEANNDVEADSDTFVHCLPETMDDVCNEVTVTTDT